MSTRLSRLLGSTPAERRARRGMLVAAVIAVPLVVAGLVSGAFAGADDTLETIPAIVVNNDEMVTMTLPDGTAQPVLAGRRLVTELTGGGTTGFAWAISNDEEAEALLASGEAYAVLTIPPDFSSSVTSLSGDEPTKANLGIRTDDAHGYLAGAVAQSVGDAMTGAFGRELTAQYLEGLYANLASVGGSLGDAAAGATRISSGAGGLAGGLGSLSAGVAAAAAGATDAANGATAYAAGVNRYAAGVDAYTSGVDGLAAGAAELERGSAALDDLTAGTSSYVSSVGAAAAGFDELAAGIAPVLEADPTGAAAERLAEFGAGLHELAAGGDVLVTTTGAGVDELQAGIGRLADGAGQLSSGSGALRAGGTELASGAGELAAGMGELANGLGGLSTGAADAATGAAALTSGAEELASGLTSGAERASGLSDIDPAETAEVVSEPVTSTAERDHEIGSIGEVIGMLFVPIGLWLGAMAMFLVFRPFGREALRSTASTPGLVGRTLARAGMLALAQAVGVVLLLHGALGVEWSLLPQTLAFAGLLALAFTAVHAWLTAVFGRAGLLVSLVLVTLQLAASGGLYPVEVLSDPFQSVSPFLPLTWAVQGMQSIVAGADGGAVAAAGMVALFGVLGATGTALAVARRRGIRSIGLAATALG